jgi:hypothetical protein
MNKTIPPMKKTPSISFCPDRGDYTRTLDCTSQLIENLNYSDQCRHGPSIFLNYWEH